MRDMAIDEGDICAAEVNVRMNIVLLGARGTPAIVEKPDDDAVIFDCA